MLLRKKLSTIIKGSLLAKAIKTKVPKELEESLIRPNTMKVAKKVVFSVEGYIEFLIP